MLNLHKYLVIRHGRLRFAKATLCIARNSNFEDGREMIVAMRTHNEMDQDTFTVLILLLFCYLITKKTGKKFVRGRLFIIIDLKIIKIHNP